MGAERGYSKRPVVMKSTPTTMRRFGRRCGIFLMLSFGRLFNHGVQVQGDSHATAAGDGAAGAAFQLPLPHRWGDVACPAERAKSGPTGRHDHKHPRDGCCRWSAPVDQGARNPLLFNSHPTGPSCSPSRSRHCSALDGSKLANAIFRGSSSNGRGASCSGQGATVLMNGLIEALRPLLSYVLVLLRSVAPSSLERQMLARLVVAASVGMFIGTERRTSHRPAGVRTMSLVALGACTFTLVSQFGFVGKADQARVAASVASGVGFIGAGVITTSGKEASIRDSLSFRGRGSGSFPGTSSSTLNDLDGEVRGLTTAGAIWITAGLGMACGAGLLFVGTFGAVLTLGILRISEVITTLRKQWIRVRSFLRPELAQKLAEEAKAREERAKAEKSDTSPVTLDEEGLEEEGMEEIERETEKEQEEEKKEKEKERKDSEKKEKKEQKEKERDRNEKEDKGKKEKEDKVAREKRENLLKMEQQEGGKSEVEAPAPAEHVFQDVSRPSSSSEEASDVEEEHFDDDELEEYEILYHKKSNVVEYDVDPFYGSPWSTEVPEVKKAPPAKDDSDTPQQPPVYSPTRKRLSRSRVLASRKRQRHRSRTAGLDFSVVPSQRSSPAELQAPVTAVYVPAPAPKEARASDDPALAMPMKTVRDLVLSEKRTSQQRHKSEKKDLQQQPPAMERQPKDLGKPQQRNVTKTSLSNAGDAEAGAGTPPFSS